MEYWNAGILGMKGGKKPLEKRFCTFIFFKSIIPQFHHSITPAESEAN
jgi:hypothetical protein